LQYGCERRIYLCLQDRLRRWNRGHHDFLLRG
jgi:hypothetical protein